MIVNKYKGQGGGGSGERGPQGYQGPEGPQGYQGAVGAQGPAGEGSQGGDSTILKATSGTPSGVSAGDVYAAHTEGSEEWSEYNSEAMPKIVKVYTNQDGTYLFHFNNNDSYFGLDFTAPSSFNGGGWGLTEDVANERYHYDNGGVYIEVTIGSDESGQYIMADITQGGTYFSMLDAYGVGGDKEMEIITPASNDVYQYNGTSGDKLAKASDLPADNRLLPLNANDSDMLLYSQYSTGWTRMSRAAVITDGMYEFQNGWSDDGQHYVMTRDGYWGVGWTPSFKMVKMTQADYDALAQGEGYDSNTLYIIIPDTNQGA